MSRVGAWLVTRPVCVRARVRMCVCMRVCVLVTPQQNHIMAERSVLLKNVRHPFLVGLRYSFQTPEKLYFVLDYVNGGEVGDPELSIPCAHGAPASGMISPHPYHRPILQLKSPRLREVTHWLKATLHALGRARI